MALNQVRMSKHCENANLLDTVQMSDAEREAAKDYMDQAETYATFIYSVEHGIEHAATELAHGLKEAFGKLVHH